MIDQNSISFETIKKDLETYVASLPPDRVWLDRNDSAIGTTVIELISGLGSFLAFKILMAQREQGIATASLRSSLTSIAQTLGYSVYRGMPAYVYFDILSTTTMSFTKFQIVGDYNAAYNLVSAEAVNIPANIATRVKVYIANKAEASQTINTDKASIFRFNIPNISEAIMITLNNTEFEYLTLLEDLRYSLFVCLTNSVNGIDIFSLNNTAPYYIPSDILKITYLEYAEVTSVDINKLSMYGNYIANFISSTPSEPLENLDHIRVSAPVRHETLSLIKSRDDYKKGVANLVPDCLHSNCLDVSPALINVSYVLPNNALLTAEEKHNILDALDVGRPFGIPLPVFVDPIASTIELVIDVKTLRTDASYTLINAQIATILTKYEHVLEEVLDLDKIEYDIETISDVKTARVYFKVDQSEVFTADNLTDLLAITLPWGNCQPVRLSTTDTLPVGLNDYTTYYVKSSVSYGSDHIGLSLVPDGPIVNITSTGVGVHTISADTTMSLQWNQYVLISPTINYL